MNRNHDTHPVPAGRAGRILPGALASVLALVMHVFTVQRISAWQPGYPTTVALSAVTPPPAIRALHLLGPVVLISLLALAALAVGMARWRPDARWTSPVLWLSSSGLLVLLLGYSWALFWVMRVSRYLQ